MTQEKISIPKDEWKLVQEYYNKHEEQLKLQRIRSPTMLLRQWMLDKYREIEQKTAEKFLSRFEHINVDSNGVKILDRQLKEVVQIRIKQDGIYCEHDETDECEHIKYALELEEVRKIVIQKRKEGWNLPLFIDYP
ncbi:MAG: hypothetical protein LBC12_05860 [Nitrososphaerota archaeon]|jgi:hypothetical protein|nr:hypothetical protein [Nitrososphaerota archaeon]